MSKDKRIRINKKMMAWSNGERTNVIPSIFHQVDDYGRTMRNYYNDFREGDEYYYGLCAMVRGECRCREYEADRAWEREHHLEALNQMIYAATMVLPDESVGFEFEDVQWLNPEEQDCWHPNLKEFRRLMRRCREYCKREPQLWPVLESNRTYQYYLKYLENLGVWAHQA
ncbi:MAG: hypothetical protein J6Y52_05680 [Bacteroidales bacterium]|nr:hypothetical protein [Bacteroidales bacterium]